jgi:hypothetical protein
MTEFDEAYTNAIKKLTKIPDQGYGGIAYLACFADGHCEINLEDRVIEDFDDIEEFITYMERL